MRGVRRAGDPSRHPAPLPPAASLGAVVCWQSHLATSPNSPGFYPQKGPSRPLLNQLPPQHAGERDAALCGVRGFSPLAGLTETPRIWPGPVGSGIFR